LKRLNTEDLVILGILTAVLFAGQVAMAFLPNVEIVSLLVILYTLVLGRKVFFIIYVFALLEGMFYGFGIWWINYLYVWSILALVVLAFRGQKSVLLFSIISGFFGIAFGALCAVPYLFAGGPGAALSYWLSGLPFDIAHCIGNVAVCLLLFKPLYAVLSKLNQGKKKVRV
jgi:energy-coupling factor transport system substrate-specific component